MVTWWFTHRLKNNDRSKHVDEDNRPAKKQCEACLSVSDTLKTRDCFFLVGSFMSSKFTTSSAMMMSSDFGLSAGCFYGGLEKNKIDELPWKSFYHGPVILVINLA